MANLNASPSTIANLSYTDPDGSSYGQSATDLISFYGVTPVAQQASTVDLLTQLSTLGLTASGTTIQTRGAPVVITAAATTTPAANSGRMNILNAAAGFAVRLPAATGTGNVYDFFVGTTVTTGTTSVVTTGTDLINGAVLQVSGASTACFFTGASNTTVSFNGTTTGGTKGDQLSFTDVSTAVWAVRVVGKVTGVAATPFS